MIPRMRLCGRESAGRRAAAATTPALLPVRHQRPCLPGALDAPPGAGLRRHHPRGEHGPRRLHGRSRRSASMAAGGSADRVRRPLVVFAAAEAGVAVAALATPLALGRGRERCTSASTAFSTAGRSWWRRAIPRCRSPSSSSPTTLMGATLPLVVKAAVARGSILGRQVSLLYAGNTAGAVSGALVAGIWMIPHLGISWAFRIARNRQSARRRRRASDVATRRRLPATPRCAAPGDDPR